MKIVTIVSIMKMKILTPVRVGVVWLAITLKITMIAKTMKPSRQLIKLKGGNQMAVKQEMNFELQPMNGTVTIEVDDYNTLLEERNQLIAQVKEMELKRVEELKAIFQLVPSYDSVELCIHAGGVVDELYGERVVFGETTYAKDPDKKLVTGIYQTYKEVKNEGEE